MVILTVASVVLIRFPFSDLSATKLPPTIILARAGRNDWILSQITSKPYADTTAVEIKNTDLLLGRLQLTSYARPGKLFTADESLLVGNVGNLSPESFQKIIDAVIRMLCGPSA